MTQLIRTHRMTIILLLGSLSAFGPLTIDMYLPAFPTITADLSTNASMTQLTLTACLLGLAVGQIIVGSVSDIYGRRFPLLCSLTAYTLSSILCAFAPSASILIVLRLVQGISGAGGIVIARACMRDLYSGSELTRMFSILMLIMGAAPVLAPIIGAQILHVVSWRGVFIVLAGIGFAMFLAVLSKLPDTLPKERRSKGGMRQTLHTFKLLLGNRVFIGYALAQGFITAGMFAYISGSPFVFQDIFQVSPQVFSLLFALNAGGLILATQITGRLAGKIAETKMLKFGFGQAVIGGSLLLLVILLDAGFVAVVCTLFITIASVGIINTVIFSLAMQSQGKNAGSASALLGLAQFVFGAVMAPLVGIGGSHTAIPMGIVIAACEIGALTFYLLLVRRGEEAVKEAAET